MDIDLNVRYRTVMQQEGVTVNSHRVIADVAIVHVCVHVRSMVRAAKETADRSSTQCTISM